MGRRHDRGMCAGPPTVRAVGHARRLLLGDGQRRRGTDRRLHWARHGPVAVGHDEHAHGVEHGKLWVRVGICVGVGVSGKLWVHTDILCRCECVCKLSRLSDEIVSSSMRFRG